ncbi:polyribonucleotide nucleotidyltransferase [Candidatus Nomurabacteria bacterium]|nr:polyribonucleotide nucleotidyltransferase [Candidatus Nomurabacteria bacterium]
MTKKEYSIEVGGRTLTAEFNDLADQTNGSVMVKYGDTTVFVTSVMSKTERDGDFFPLTVDYEEKFYASGQILGSRYVRREGKPSDEAILSGRIVDRTIRPLFDQHIRREIQVVITTLSIGKEDPDILGVIGASLALGTSNIPWNGPVSAVRLGKTKTSADYVINPEHDFIDGKDFEMDLVACGKNGNINMIEVAGREISESLATESLKKASEEIEKIQDWQAKIIKEIGKEKVSIPKPEILPEIVALYEKEIAPKLMASVFSNEPGKKHIEELKEAWLKLCEENKIEKLGQADEYYEEKVNDLIHSEAIEKNKRADGRKMDELRPLFAKAGGISPILHGAGIFYRGGTHVLSITTLGGPQEALTIDGAEEQATKRFMHHYNFPPFSSGETGRMGGVNRRMVGHGALAEKALFAVIPPKEIFPYTIRVVSESMASNGSTSMGSVCAGTLSLMDAGVPIKAPVAGIASGLMMKDENNYKVLTDIQGPEDHHGDMDFKVAGTREGITAVQMDVKVGGIPIKILSEAFDKARLARLQILDLIEKEIPAPRKEIAGSAPKIVTINVLQDQIGLVIGPGGKTIKQIKAQTGAEIDIEDDGTIFITGKNGSADKARQIIYDMTREYKAGEKFQGEVVKVLDFGAFVRIGFNAEGLVHVSEISPERVMRVADVLKEGDIVPVIIKEIDDKKRINLSIKRVDPDFLKNKLKK